MYTAKDMKDNELCPCGSKKEFGSCCGPIIAGTKKAETAEELMRSRYTAYVTHDIDHIVKTCRAGDEESTWQGLKILRTEKGTASDKEGIVEFSATYTRKGLRDVHLERAYFKKENDTWIYEAGELIPTTVVREGEKVGRNDPCPCGSGKKYKKCCGR